MNKRKVTAKLLAFGKKNRFCKILSIGALFVYLLQYYVRCYFRGNVRKYASVFCVIFFFLASTSFTYIDDGQISTDESSFQEFEGNL
ncbi:MAG: hypothetical protein IJ711_07230, partial [Lachnospiraceae bacterium]|nr:hypothetical protein [Lachnospiraceae bacterium]